MRDGRQLAEAIRCLDVAQGLLVGRVFDIVNGVTVRTRKIASLIEGAHRGSVHADTVLALQGNAREASLVFGRTGNEAVGEEIDRLKAALWLSMPPAEGPQGYLHPLGPDREPVIPKRARYVPAPLRLPEVIDINLAHQGRKTCYFAAAVDAIAHRRPHLLAGVARPEGDEVIVTVRGGIYRMPATLPVDATTGEPVYSFSLDGSTLVPYLEKAAATHFGSYLDIALGSPIAVMLWLGGANPTVSYYCASEVEEDELQQTFPREEPACLSIAPTRRDGSPVPAALLDRLDLSTGHTYIVDKVDRHGDVVLRDQQVEHQPKAVSMRELRELDAQVAWLTGPASPRHKPTSPGAAA